MQWSTRRRAGEPTIEATRPPIDAFAGLPSQHRGAPYSHRMSPVALPPDRPVAPNPFEFLPATGSFDASSVDVSDGAQMALTHVY